MATRAKNRNIFKPQVNTSSTHVPGLRPGTCLKEVGYILGQKRNATYKTYIVYGGLSPISRKRFVTSWLLILGLWVPGVVLAIMVTRRNWFSSLNLRFYRSWRRVIRRWRHECARSDIVPNCQKRFLRHSIVLAWHRNCWAIIDGVTLACNILIALSRSTCVRFDIVN